MRFVVLARDGHCCFNFVRVIAIVTVLHPQSALLQVVNKLECGRSFEGGLSAAFGVGSGHVLLHCPQHPGESLINVYTLHNCM